MIMKDSIFREYDIRGIYGKDYDPDFASALAKALCQFVKEKSRIPGNGRPRFRLAVGRDVRHSGVELSKRFISSLIESGFDVIDLNVAPTPLVYFSLFEYDIDGAVCITGSHNPAEYNGFKICVGRDTLHGSDIQRLKQLIQSTSAIESKSHNAQSQCVVTTKDVISDYKKFMQDRFRFRKNLKVVVDAGNACAGLVAPALLKSLGCEVIELYCDIDGRFPNHHPDPTVESNLKDLKKAVLEHRADVGIAYDGDADRIGAVDEKGRTIFGDELMVLYSREILKRKPGSKIIGEVKCSHRLYQDIAKNGGQPLMWKTGHSLIKSKMKSEKAELAGEMSGHIFFADRYLGYDDAIYASIRLIEIMEMTQHPLSALLGDLPQTVSTPELRVDCPDDLKFQIVDQVKSVLSQQFKTIDIDGVRIETERGWGLLRASNTQPVVVMRFEAQTEKELQDLRTTVESAFEKALKQT